MNQKPAYTVPLSVTTPQKPQNVVMDVSQFKIDPKAVSDEKQTRSLLGAIVLGALVGGIGFVTGRYHSQPLIATLAGAGLGAAAGWGLGQIGKTREETTSEALQAAGQSHNFAQAIKREMKQRENSAYSEGFFEGALIGIPFMW